MRSPFAGPLGVCLLLLAGSSSASNFNFQCPEDRYVSIALGQAHQFSSPIEAVPPGNDRVQVTFRPHLPEGWAASWHLRSTGVVFESDGQVDLVAGLQDRLDIDVTPTFDAPRYGWIDLTLRSTEDPLEVARCTYTLFAGMPVPPVDWDIDCSDNTLYIPDPYSYFEIHSPLVNHLAVADTLLVEMDCDLPPEWGMHFHHNNVCYTNPAELPVPPMSAPDSMVIMGGAGAVAGMAVGDMILQSKRNPSVARYCHYQVIYDMPQGTPDPAPAMHTPAVRVAPNPSAGEAAFFFRPAPQASGALSIFGADGRLVRSFPAVSLAVGAGPLRWDGRDEHGARVAPGIYFYRLGAGPAAYRGTIVRTR